MTTTNILNKNDLSTIAVWIFTIIAPYVSAYITQETFTTLFVAIIGLIIAIYSSKNPNTMEILGNQPVTLETQETVLNDEYETNGDEA